MDHPETYHPTDTGGAIGDLHRDIVEAARTLGLVAAVGVDARASRARLSKMKKVGVPRESVNYGEGSRSRRCRKLSTRHVSGAPKYG